MKFVGDGWEGAGFELPVWDGASDGVHYAGERIVVRGLAFACLCFMTDRGLLARALSA